MKRVLEPELMDDAAQARAYAKADFAEENQGFVDRFREYFPDWAGGHVVDLGCGPGDIPIRFLRSFPDARVTAVDASRPMLDLAAEAIAIYRFFELLFGDTYRELYRKISTPGLHREPYKAQGILAKRLPLLKHPPNRRPAFELFFPPKPQIFFHFSKISSKLAQT